MLRVIMSVTGKVNPPNLEGVTAGLGKGLKSQARAFKSQSSPVYKTQSDNYITSGMRGLTLKDSASKSRGIQGGTNNNRGAKTTLKSLEDVAVAMRDTIYKNVVVVAGAGISTPSGIPDFRTPGTGLYDNLKQYRIPYPEAIFDIDFFHHNPKPFFTLAKELYPSGKYRPNYIHYFLRLLHDKGMLLRMYTQNIDGLERLAGIPPEKLVEAHGTFSSATCVICRQKHEGPEVKDAIFADRLPKCKKRGCPGIVKPDITFFGEDLPQRFYFYLKDMIQTDLVIVLGTSLEVQPFAGIVDTVKWGVPRVLFNMQPVGPFKYHRRAQDFLALGDLIESVQKFTKMAGWSGHLSDLITKEEGSFTICSPDYAKKVEEMKKNPPPRPPPMWRQGAQLDIYSSDSDTSESDSDSESSSSDEGGRRNRRNSRPVRRAWGRVKNTSETQKNGANKISGSKNSVSSGKRNYSTDVIMSSRSDRSNTSTISKSSTISKAASEVIGNASKYDRFKLRSKNHAADTSKEGNHTKVIRRTSSDKSIRFPNTGQGQKQKLQRSNSAKAITTKDSEDKLNDGKLNVKQSGSDGNLVSGSRGSHLNTKNEGGSDSAENGDINSVSVKKENKNRNNNKQNISKTSKPPLPQKKAMTPKNLLNTLNARPYGFLSQRQLQGRPSLQANLLSNRTLNNGPVALNQRANSAELPKITYRHRLKPSYDARIFAVPTADSSSEESDEDSSSDDDSR